MFLSLLHYFARCIQPKNHKVTIQVPDSCRASNAGNSVSMVTLELGTINPTRMGVAEAFIKTSVVETLTPSG